MALSQHILVPIASDDDARATCEAIEPYVDDIERVTAVHVIEKAGGGIDKAPVDKRKEDAADFLGTFESLVDDRVPVTTDTYFGTDVVETLFEAAIDSGADAIAFRARGGSRLTRLLAGDLATDLVTDPAVPVISIPDPNR